MNLLESPMFSADQLMIGPDGAVYVLPTATLAASQPPGGLHGAIASPSLRDPSRDINDDGGQRSGCFVYSADVAVGDGGTSGGCFMYSADVALDGTGEGSGCFVYSADAAVGDGGTAGGCFMY
jgi:hypothetical protein